MMQEIEFEFLSLTISEIVAQQKVFVCKKFFSSRCGFQGGISTKDLKCFTFLAKQFSQVIF